LRHSGLQRPAGSQFLSKLRPETVLECDRAALVVES
jgi:hypothetical protein